jgi:predicted TIM-barrel fold metal-dependent hydrolase
MGSMAGRYFEFRTDTRAPVPRAPAGACDCQFHVFGPRQQFRIRPGAAYEMPSATVEAALAMHRTLGVTRGVIVQSTAYGTDHGALLAALVVAGPDYKGCAVVDDSVSDCELERLHGAGVCAVRFNFHKTLNMMPTRAEFERTIDRIRGLGWIVKVHPDPASGLDDVLPWLDAVDAPVVIDHLGRPDFAQGAQGRRLKQTLDLLDRGYWIMLSNAYKQSKQPFPWEDAIPVVRVLVERAPDRAIWATDWPHPLSTEPPPNDADILELFYRCVPEPDLQRKILIENPQTLFGFASP